MRETKRYALEMQIRKATKTGFFAPGRQSRGGKIGGSRNTTAQQNARRENMRNTSRAAWDDPVFREMMRQRSRQNAGDPQIGQLAKKASHTRWHAGRGIRKASCPYCAESSQ
jgi:hypothetical protein